MHLPIHYNLIFSESTRLKIVKSRKFKVKSNKLQE